jgi:hypothetical protein
MLAHPALECFAGSVLAGEVQGARSQCGDVGPVDGLDKRLAGGKVPVDRRVAEFGAATTNTASTPWKR